MAIESMYVFTGDEVVATDLPAKLNENFAKTETNMLKTVNNVAQDENHNINVTELIPKQITSNTNLNNLVTSGEYTFTKGSATITNSPTPNSFFLTVLKNNALVKQVVTEVAYEPITYTRVLSGSSWSPWVEGGKVKTINNIEPDDSGNVDLGIIPIANGGTGATTASNACKNLGILDLVYPVGSLYWSKKSTDPATLFGGTWTRIKDKFILAAGDSYAQGATGGEASHTLTVGEIPSHSHTGSADSVGNHSHTQIVNGTDSDVHPRNGAYNSGSEFSATTRNSCNTSGAGAHSHTVTINATGGGAAHNNMPPYVTYYCWERTA